MTTLMLIDGNSLAYRAFYALPTDMSTSGGQVTNACFGFTSMLTNLLRDHQPQHLAVAFDLKEPTFRHKAYSEYKAGRQKTPDILHQQLGLIRQIVETLEIPVIETPGFEADDAIATLAKKAAALKIDVIAVTGDRDAYQLVEDPHIKVLYNRRGVSDYALYNEAGILERTGVQPSKYVDYAALRGDKSDNLPGVAGVGEKTAAKLLDTYGDIDGIYQNIDELTPKLRENLIESEPNVRRNLEMMPLVTDVAIDLDLDELKVGGIDADKVRELFDFLEFRALYDRLNVVLNFDSSEVNLAELRVIEAETQRPETPQDAIELLRELSKTQNTPESKTADKTGETEPDKTSETTLVNPLGLAVCVDNHELVGIAISTCAQSGNTIWIPETHLDNSELCAELNKVLSAETHIVGHKVKEGLRSLLTYGIEVTDLKFDTAIAAYLLDPSQSDYPIQELLSRFASAQLPDSETVTHGQLDLISASEQNVDAATQTAREALAALVLAEPMEDALADNGLAKLNNTIEVPLINVLASMEYAGIAVDLDVLNAIHDGLVKECERLRSSVIEAAGEEFNLNSPKQLQVILFEKLGLTPGRKTKTGYSTNAATLEKLRSEHHIVNDLLEYREVEKLRSTYGQGLLEVVDKDSRIRATFNQTVARTGRLSSDNPNLHNIPVRSERGRAFRKAFIAPAGFTFLIADYNQIELRCIAHLAQDPGLIAAFEAGDDIHRATAARIFHVADEDVTLEQRSKSKMVSYGLAYGMEAYGLGQRLGVSTPEAQRILDAYFAAFPAVDKYMKDTVEQTRERGYTETLFGRRRQIPELASSNFRIRQAGERQAMNAGIQGLAADIFKVALVQLDRRLKEAGTDARVILQVHDEVILEVRPEELDEIRELVVDVMGSAFDLRVSLDVNLADGPTWAAAKG